MTECRSCGAPIFFVRHEYSGKRMPLDVEPVADGNIFLDDEGEAHVLSRGDEPPYNARLYRSHFATCTSPGRHRRKKGKGNQ